MKNPFINKEGKISKTKVGTFCIGLAAVVGTVGSFLQGNMDIVVATQQIFVQVGALLAMFGIRDLPILNKLK